MDPLTTLSLAGTVVQFVDFGSTLLSCTRGLYKSKTGTLDANQELALVTTDLQALIDKLRRAVCPNDVGVAGYLAKTADDDQERFQLICDEAAEVAKELIKGLNKLKIKESRNRKWESIRQAVRVVWTEKEIAALVKRLASFKEALNARVLLSIRQVLSI
jgi:hypothetical protein